MIVIKRFLYYFWSLTWNSLTTVIGAIVALAFLIGGRKPFKFGPSIVFPYRGAGGGFSLGIFTFINENATKSYSILAHEYGHSLQGLIFGPFWFIIIGIPSVLRFWYREIKINKGKGANLPPYRSIWFERTATEWGEKYAKQEWIQR